MFYAEFPAFVRSFHDFSIASGDNKRIDKKEMVRFMKYIFKFVNLLVIGVLLQAVYFFLLIFGISSLSPALHGLLVAGSVIIALYIAGGFGGAAYRLMWVLFILALPVIGGVTYLFYNGGKHSRGNNLALKQCQDKAMKHRAGGQEAEVNPRDSPIISYMEKAVGMTAVRSDITYYPLGEDFFEAFKKDIARAERYIFIEFFIIEQGTMWDALLWLLAEKVREGVDVRVIYDGTGSAYTLPHNYAKKLAQAGIRCAVYSPVRGGITPDRNMCSHRKIVSVDGSAAYTGGLNLADEYINVKHPFGHWKDTAMRVTGGAAWDFTLIFLSLWEHLTGEDSYARCAPRLTAPSGEGVALVWNDIPDDSEPVCERIFLLSLYRAREHIYIVSPYLAPPEALMTALCTAAKSGVDVRLYFPFIPDKYFVHAVTKSYYRPLLEAGVRIFEYSPGFVHAKQLVCDGDYAMLGTVNLDFRSIYMQHECGVLLFGEEPVRPVAEDIAMMEQSCKEIVLSDYLLAGWCRRGLRRVCRILAPLI